MATTTAADIRPRKVIVTIAPTGGMASKEQNPNLPTQPEEIADDVAACVEAGASVAAIHARRPEDDLATCSADVYGRINEAVRQRTDVVINISTGGGISGDMIKENSQGQLRIDFAERLRGLEAPHVEMATFDAESFVITTGGREIINLTTPAQCDELAARMTELGIKPEWEVMSTAHIRQDPSRLINAGFDAQPYWVNVVLGLDRGFQGALPYTPRILHQMVDELPEGAELCVSAVAANQLPAITHAVLLGGHVRVGLEDNLYYRRGELATNVQLVERAVRIIRELGHEVATPQEARQILGLKSLASAQPVPTSAR
ncbi:3-keto-5-aminohexanoate cleavage protein [Georgenia sp. EYE_87]|uniref:3-keto-5-aminohexanoate cleavage protein n=1 Tax=Georgenia sp. EYE_87 TaxID=2853448 RepID=UPI0020032183|nr:3-keto-5-aminohexanoate cleavage protein [Georgenia sp. EYE_87]MCK6208965.1 3-keto-5-aminohexanoate cleavage protein [Georgenia sp. EYE_87]